MSSTCQAIAQVALSLSKRQEYDNEVYQLAKINIGLNATPDDAPSHLGKSHEDNDQHVGCIRPGTYAKPPAYPSRHTPADLG
jgi:hypothetical protein